MVQWIVDRRAPKSARIVKVLELSKRLADTIRNSDLSESKRTRLAIMIDNQIDRHSYSSKDLALEFNQVTRFDAALIVHSHVLTDELYGAAAMPMRPLQALNYATQLEVCVDRYIAERTRDEREINVKACADVISAVKWIHFWVSKGFGYECEY